MHLTDDQPGQPLLGAVQRCQPGAIQKDGVAGGRLVAHRRRCLGQLDGPLDGRAELGQQLQDR